NAIQGARRQGQITEQDLLLLVGRFISPERVQHSFAEQFAAPPRMIQRHASEDMILCGERLIASVLGASSAATIMDTVLRGIDLGIDQMFQLVDDASNQIQSSQDQMRGAIEHAAEGISVVDKELNMVAWNQTYVQLFEYPEGFLTQGMPVAEVIRYNANLGRCGPGDVDAHVARRVGYMQAGSAHRSERIRSDGRVIRMLGNPMPDGGFVMSFSDITEFRQQQQALTEINDTLEQRVAARTEELLKLNQRLRQAKAAEEQANQSKGRFLAAVGHDLMQPLNAARLFTASLLQAPERTDEDHTTLTHLAGSLRNAGEMLSDLLDISKLDGQHLAVDRQTVRLSLVLEPLAVEFSAMAASKGLQWRCHIPDVAIETDANLLRRIVQNFLTNALRYTEQGRILLGCRRRGYQLEIQVFDSGNGIAKADSERIFDEFQQLADRSASGGLGLGLAIAKRIATMLAHPLRLQSQLGKGSMFSVTVPLGTALMPQAEPIKLMPNWQPLAGVRVLCIDNDRSILIALQGLLNGWHCEVLAVPSLAVAQVHLAEDDWRPQIVLADYHLDDNKTGLDALLALREGYGDNLPGILMTADTRTELIEQVEQLGFGFMAKMVKPAGLKALMSALLRQQRLPQQQAELMPMN
ncbi:MAG: PAS-domain containing protein, partial [Ferrimonas sp.]